MKTIAVVGTLDTKGTEHAFVSQCIRELGYQPLLIDVGTFAEPTVSPDVCRDEVYSFQEIANTDRGTAIDQMSRALPGYLLRLVDEKKIDGVISLGGTGGTAIGTAAMRVLPMGFPKVMVTTVASGDVSRYVDISDILMFPSIVDVSGLNRISQGVFARAAATVVAMAESNARLKTNSDLRPLIVASMFGNTTRCVEHAKALLEAAGYEVLVFHATGIGGRKMEALIESGAVTGVLDITTTEWADELVGGILPGGNQRLGAAATHGVPAVVTPGCLDMVNFGQPESVPEKHRGRVFYQHNPQITLMRTTPAECERLGRIIAQKLNASIGEVRFLYPRKAISILSAEGQPFYSPEADRALLNSLQSNLRPDIPFEIVDCEINDPQFAERCAQQLLQAIESANR